MTWLETSMKSVGTGTRIHIRMARLTRGVRHPGRLGPTAEAVGAATRFTVVVRVAVACIHLTNSTVLV